MWKKLKLLTPGITLGQVGHIKVVVRTSQKECVRTGAQCMRLSIHDSTSGLLVPYWFPTSSPHFLLPIWCDINHTCGTEAVTKSVCASKTSSDMGIFPVQHFCHLWDSVSRGGTTTTSSGMGTAEVNCSDIGPRLVPRGRSMKLWLSGSSEETTFTSSSSVESTDG